MENIETLPINSKMLIEKLDKAFPMRNPNVSMTEKEIFYEAGKRSIVEFLLQKLKEQEEGYNE